MKLTVLIPSWKRVELLEKCLAGLIAQTRQADEVLLIYQASDSPTKTIGGQYINRLPLKIVEVDQPGVIHAENAGIKNSTGDIICFIDDDAVAPKHWLETIEKHFLGTPELGGVGGSDLIVHHHNPQYRQTVNQVGFISEYGKVTGNHHHTTSEILEVDVLKGVNMALRKEIIPLLDENLQSLHSEGNGSHWELDLSMQIRRDGYKLIFDPSIDVTHYSRHEHFIHNLNLQNNARNLTYVLLKNFNSIRRFKFLLYFVFIGNSQIYGVGKLLQQILLAKPIQAFIDYYFSSKGFIKGISLFLKRLNSR